MPYADPAKRRAKGKRYRDRVNADPVRRAAQRAKYRAWYARVATAGCPKHKARLEKNRAANKARRLAYTPEQRRAEWMRIAANRASWSAEKKEAYLQRRRERLAERMMDRDFHAETLRKKRERRRKLAGATAKNRAVIKKKARRDYHAEYLRRRYIPQDTAAVTGKNLYFRALNTRLLRLRDMDTEETELWAHTIVQAARDAYGVSWPITKDEVRSARAMLSGDDGSLDVVCSLATMPPHAVRRALDDFDKYVSRVAENGSNKKGCE